VNVRARFKYVQALRNILSGMSWQRDRLSRARTRSPAGEVSRFGVSPEVVVPLATDGCGLVYGDNITMK